MQLYAFLDYCFFSLYLDESANPLLLSAYEKKYRRFIQNSYVQKNFQNLITVMFLTNNQWCMMKA